MSLANPNLGDSLILALIAPNERTKKLEASPPKEKGKLPMADIEDDTLRKQKCVEELTTIHELEEVNYNENSPNHEVKMIVVETERCSKSQ